MTARKMARVILSPIIFIGLLSGFTFLAIGPLSLILGIVWIASNLLSESKDKDPVDWTFVFAWITGPVLITYQFITEGNLGE